MEIVVCVKRVPDTAELEIEINRSGSGIEERDLAYGVNEWDNFAIEAALALKEEHGGKVTAITIGGEDDEEVLRRALAMGADEAIHLSDPAFEGSDAQGIATILHKAISARPFDLVLTGAVSSDRSSGQVGGMLAALLDIPQVVLATDLKIEGGKATVAHEVEGGLERVVELDLPALVSVQTGLNEPRYVSIRGIRKVSSMEIPLQNASELGLDASSLGAAGAMVTVEEIFLPPKGDGAEMLEGDDEEMVEQLVGKLREQGGL
jgi:electron transfer flavoprotein beta subunit